MNNYKSIRDLIVKAALYDGVTTTIGPDILTGGPEILKITFKKDNTYITAYIDTASGYRDHEELVLDTCKRSLRKLLFAPYEKIEVVKEN